MYNTLWKTPLKSNHVFSILVVTECRLPTRTITLIVLGVLALVTILVGATVTIFDGITDCCIQLNKCNLNIGDCCSEKQKEESMGEYSSVVLLVGPCLARVLCISCFSKGFMFIV